MTRIQHEKKLVVEPIIKKLSSLKFTGEIVWYQRLVAEDDSHCPAGTPDIVAVVNNGDGTISLLFIECKRPSKKMWTLDNLKGEQKIFFQKMMTKTRTSCVVLNNKNQLWSAIEKARNA